MQIPDYTPQRNHLLARIPNEELRIIEPELEHIELEWGEVIAGADRQIDYVYFPCSGIGSVVTVSTEGQKAQAGMFGREGFSPTSAGVGGSISVQEVLVQLRGDGFRIRHHRILEILPQSPVFANLLARYIQTFASQISYTSFCNASYQVDVRLARWLLMCHDRVNGNEIALTHDFISLMLSVRRPSITTALHILEGKKLLRAERARITIRDRRGLEEFAGDAYGKPEAEYRRLVGDL